MNKIINQAIYLLKNYWLALLGGAGVSLVIVLIVVLTTKTDAISSYSPDVETNTSTTSPTLVSQTATSGSIDGVSTSSNKATTSNQVSSQPDNNPTNPFDVTISAESAIVWDIENQVALFSKQAQKEQPLASLTKLMTALVGAQTTERTGQRQTVISQQHLDALGSNGLVAGQTWNVYDLISFMLIESSNDAARAVAASGEENQADGYSKEFVEDMNQTARDLGLESTYFFNPSGLDLNEDLISGGYGSALDVARLFSHILQTNQHILTPTTNSTQIFRSAEGVNYSAHNTNSWLSNFSDILGSKTGYTVLAGGNLVMGFDLQRPVVITVLGSTKEGRFQDVHALYKETKKYFNQERQTSSNQQDIN